MTVPRFLPLAAFAGLVGGVALAVPEADPLTKGEMDGLRSLHSTAVKYFVDQFGFGFSRMKPNVTDLLNPPASAADGSVAPQQSAQQVRDPQAIKKGAEVKNAHFPLTKVVAQRAYLPAPAEGKQWAVKDIQLVGLVKHQDPVVYLAGGAADGGMAKDGKEEAKQERTREPDAFETKGLEVVRGGGGVHAERRDAKLRAVAGIYAGKQCAACHERTGELLGAFSYRLAVEDAPAVAAAP